MAGATAVQDIEDKPYKDHQRRECHLIENPQPSRQPHCGEEYHQHWHETAQCHTHRTLVPGGKETELLHWVISSVFSGASRDGYPAFVVALVKFSTLASVSSKVTVAVFSP